MEYYKGKSTRLKGFNYGRGGFYHVVFCCHDRIHRFGNIQDYEMELNEFGHIADEEFILTVEHFDSCITHAYQIMPNHIHWLLEIRKISGRTPLLGEIIAKYKACVFGKCLRYCKSNNIILGKFWQSGFYDSIITTEQKYKNAVTYILNNPKQWEIDRFNKNNNNTSNL